MGHGRKFVWWCVVMRQALRTESAVLQKIIKKYSVQSGGNMSGSDNLEYKDGG